jgi:hypothetical protein
MAMVQLTSHVSLSYIFTFTDALIPHCAIDTIYCIDIEKYSPDLILIDFSVNDYGHPKQMDTLLRRAVSLPSRPVVLLVNLWVTKHCPQTRYLLHAYYYRLSIINICPAADLCFGKHRFPPSISSLYSPTDGVHPWGSKGVKFIGDILFAWWKRLELILTNDVQLGTNGKTIVHQHSFDAMLKARDDAAASSNATVIADNSLPPPLYVTNPIGICTWCAALVEDADAQLIPVSGSIQGFRAVTRVKVAS